MEFNMPTASRKRLEELLEYLGKTENYSNDYKGNRAEDFKKCFDIESEWCWKYADIMLRGMEKRDLEYSEGHHVIPASLYGKRRCRMVDDGNITTLSYAEHVWAHYCAVYCTIGENHGKMTRAFITMYKIGICKKRPLMPSEEELLAAIPEMEIKKIQSMEPQWAKVEAEGRTHKSEDPKQYNKDYYEANKEQIAEYKKTYRKANKEKLAEQHKDYYEANKDKILEQKKAYRETNKEQIAEKNKDYRKANKEKLAEKDKARREAKKAAGYLRRKNPLTGKKEWVFVGLPESPKSTEAA